MKQVAKSGATISNVGTLGRDGMYETNEKIIEMMLKNTR